MGAFFTFIHIVQYRVDIKLCLCVCVCETGWGVCVCVHVRGGGGVERTTSRGAIRWNTSSKFWKHFKIVWNLSGIF